MINMWISAALLLTAIWLGLCTLVVYLLNRNDKKHGSKVKE